MVAYLNYHWYIHNTEKENHILVYDSQMILFYCANGKLQIIISQNLAFTLDSLTISVASTRVPTIFRRTRVFFSMI